MHDGSKKELTDLLDKILVFDYDFKIYILQKLESGLDKEKLRGLEKMLLETIAFQRKVFAEKNKKDPGFFRRLSEIKNQFNKGVIDKYSQNLASDDKKKMDIILSKIKSL